jgi:hypothetical protein
MTEKKQAGRRTGGRHLADLTASGALALYIVGKLPESLVADPTEHTLAGIVLTGAFSQVAKLLDDQGIFKRIPGVKTISIVLLMSLVLSGCTFHAGVNEPVAWTGADGETILSCETKGLSFSIGGGAVCRETMEGDHLSKGFTNMVVAIFNGIGRVTGAIFGGFSAPPTPMVE